MQGIILSGIYQHYKGRLYFVTHTFNYKGKNGDVESVYYYPLYEVSDGYGRSIDDFIEQAYEEDGVAVERFKLIMALPPEAKNILLYGSIVISTRGSSRKSCVRQCCFWLDSLCVVVANKKGSNAFPWQISIFLKEFKKAE